MNDLAFSLFSVFIFLFLALGILVIKNKKDLDLMRNGVIGSNVRVRVADNEVATYIGRPPSKGVITAIQYRREAEGCLEAILKFCDGIEYKQVDFGVCIIYGKDESISFEDTDYVFKHKGGIFRCEDALFRQRFYLHRELITY